MAAPMAAPLGMSWEQDDVELIVKFDLPQAVTTRAISCRISSTALDVAIDGVQSFCDELSGRIDSEESFWAVEGTDAGRHLVITLTKSTPGLPWPHISRRVPEEEHGSAGSSLSSTGLLDDAAGDEPEDAEAQHKQEKVLEEEFNRLRRDCGLDNESTLAAFFDLFNISIQLYHLNKLGGYLAEVVPVCRRRDDSYKLKAIQAHAFVLWKQQDLGAAIELFLEMETLMGKNAALCENIAHTYNSLGDYVKAEDYFRQSLQLIESGCAPADRQGGNRGGVLLGLGLVRDRLERPAEALPILEKAYEFYRDRAQGQPSSLQGKAAVSCGMVELKLGDSKRAEQYLREAIQTYEITCGETSPLTGGAYFKLGQILWEQRRRPATRKALKRAYELEVIKDAFTIVGLLEIHNSIERSGFATFFPVVANGLARVQRDEEQDGNAACYYKAAGELLVWGGNYTEAIACASFNLAIELFKVEKSRDCSQFVDECMALSSFAARNLAGQASPMVLETALDQSTPGAASGSQMETAADASRAS